MAAPKRPLDPDHLFNILKLNKYFAISSVVLLISVLLMIKQDYDREWKAWQRQFRSLEIQKTKEKIGEAEAELVQNADYMAAKAALGEASKATEAREVEMFHQQKVVDRVKGERNAIFTVYQDKKSELDATRYELEEAKHHKNPDVKSLEKDYRKIVVDTHKAKAAADAAEARLADAEKKLAGFTVEKEAAQKVVKDLHAKLDRLQRKEQFIGRSFVNDLFRDAPMLDFIDPSLKVKEIIIPNLTADYNFLKIPRADACITCHVSIDMDGYEDQPNPLKTHPRRDLFLSSKSPHPIGDYGCTVCHQGQGGGLTFTNATHSPQNEKQAEEWEKKYHWHRSKHWAEPMLPVQYTEATCYGCHQKDWVIKGGDKITAGMRLVEQSGCYACHKIQGWEELRNTGPNLKRISSKVSEEWMTKWIRNPRLFRPTTTMPQVFDLMNTDDATSKRRNSATIKAIIQYLRTKSEPYAADQVSLAGGDAGRGKTLLGKVGCLGCHAIDDFPPMVAEPVEGAPPSQPKRPFGPELNQVGSKLSPEWLAAWLKNPTAYWPETKMPNLRLTDREIADLVAYLMTKKNPTFEASTIQQSDNATLGIIAMDFLKSRMPEVDAKVAYAKMSPEERVMFVGEKSIAHYGCYNCHVISGFENAKPMGTELTYEASKPITRFDFGLVKVEETVQGWVRQKLLEPRIYDNGKIKEPLEKLRMPKFNFTEQEADAIVTFVMALRKYDIPLNRLPKQTPEHLAVQKGRRLIVDRNCMGCHILEGKGGDILAHYGDDPTLGPPNLNGEGMKVKQDWLYGFLGAPSPIRAWLEVRMPSFGFSTEKKNALIGYFRGLDGLSPQIEPEPPMASQEQLREGAKAFTVAQCARCHRGAAGASEEDKSNLAPSFLLSRNRLRYDWITEWIRDPQKLMPGTRMPALFYSEGQPFYPDSEQRISYIRDHVYFNPPK